MVHTPTFWILSQCNITLVLQLWWLRWPRKARHATKLLNRLSIYDGKRYRIGSWYSAFARSRWGITVSWHFWLGAFGNNMPSAKLRLTHWKSTTSSLYRHVCHTFLRAILHQTKRFVTSRFLLLWNCGRRVKYACSDVEVLYQLKKGWLPVSKAFDKLGCAFQIHLRHSPSGILATLCDESLNHVLRPGWRDS